MKPHFALLAGLLFTTSTNATPIAVHRDIDANGMITYIILTDEEVSAPVCIDLPLTKRAKISIGTKRNDIAPFMEGCWFLNEDGDIRLLAPQTELATGASGKLPVSAFEKTQAFGSWNNWQK